jgi:F-type H+-transporting ATPase subunit epsilon
MSKLYLEVVTPARVVVSLEVDIVVAPGSEGEFGVLPEHVTFLTGVVPGELRYASGPEKGSLAVTSGFAEVSNNKVSVLVDAAEKSNDIDLDRVKRAMERAKERLTLDRDRRDIDFLRAEAALRRAVARLKVAQKPI